MKKSILSLSKIIFFIIFLISCGETIEVTTSFQDEIPLAGNLTFTFDDNIVPQEKVNVWDTTQYVIFEPEVKGRFRWVSRSRLVFSPYNYLTPATEFQAKFNKKIFKEFSEKLDYDEMVFHTPYLEMNSSSGYWTIDEANLYKPYLVIDLSYSYRVNPTDIKDFITVTVNGTEKEVKLLKKDISQFVSIYITDIETDTEGEMKISVTSKQGLPAYDVLTTLKETQNLEFTVQSPKTFEVINSSGEHDGFSGKIYVETSQEVNSENLSDFITIFPNVNFTVDKSGKNIIVTSSEFDISKEYSITLKENLTGILGGILKYSYTNSIRFGQLDASIKFVDKKATYLSAKGEKNIQLYLVNVPEAHVKITKVYENNILAYLGTGYYYYDYYYDYYDYDWGYGDDAPGTLGDVVYEEDIVTKDLEINGNFRLLNLDFEDKISGYEGLYVVEVSSNDDYWLKKRKVVSISDIGIIVKKGLESITVFANSISTAEAMSNVKIKFFGTNNQELATKYTDAEGVAVYEIADLPAENFDAMMVTASYNSDFNYLHFSRSAIETSDFEIWGAEKNFSGYDAFIYPERDIYRPDETIHLSAILRDYDWNTPEEIPLVLKIFAPNGKEYKTLKKTLNKAGSIEAEIFIPADAMTGTYYAELYTSNEVFLTSQAIMVEEFMPDRIKVVAELNSEIQTITDEAILSITATNLFGPPAKDRNYTIEQDLYLKYFYPEDYDDYNFSISERTSYFNSISRDGVTDDDGKATETFTIDETYKDMGIIRASYFVTVFDENGRSVNQSVYSDIYTQDVFYGLKYPDYYNTTDEKMTFEIVALDKDENLLSGTECQVLIKKHEYNTVLAKDGSYYRYKSEHSEVVLKDEVITLNGKTTYTFTPETSGQYEIHVTKPNTATYVSADFYAYGFGETTTTSFNVDSDGKIDIELDMDKYQVGSTANVLLKAPFSGKILVTVENDNVVEYFYIETDKKVASFELPIKAEYVPNIYITATLFRPHTVSELPIMTAHGFVPVLVENEDNKLPLEIIASENSKSNVTQTIKIKSKPNTSLTIAVVDEGILQLTDFETPAPYEFFYRKRALEVFSYDVYPYLFPEIVASTILKGGDGSLDLSKRINPLTNKRVKLVSFWSGIIETDASGNANFDIAIPQFSGSLRIMAVAHKDEKFASAEKNMTVADDIVVSTGLPRFLSPGDEIEVPVTLTNTTSSSAICSVMLTISGPLENSGVSLQSATISANDEKKLVYKLKTKNEIGEAKVTVSVSALGNIYKEELDITVRPASTLMKVSGSGSITAGSSQTISMAINNFMPESIDKKLIVSTNPLIQFTENLDYLVTYPYGCVEQTVSAAFPQLYYPELSKLILNDKDVNTETPDYNINEAIRKIKLMQLYNGGLTYWSGGGTESWWGTAFAAHFFIEAKKLGYEVDETTLNLMLSYLEMKLKDKSTITYYYNFTEMKQIAPKAVAYSLFVLALAETPSKSTMNYYKSNRDILSIDSKYLLAAAYALTGDLESFNEIIPDDFSGDVSLPVFSGDFYSPIRDEAIALYSLIEVDADNQQIGIMAKHLSEKVAVANYLSTQENVFTYLAMGKIAKLAEKSDISGTVKVNGTEIANFKNDVLTLNTADFEGGELEITTTGTGTLYYFWDAEGISSDGSYIEEDKYLQVRRYFYDTDGNEITSKTFKQSDLVLVRISVIGSTTVAVDNVVVTDILPAGFEIENARVTSLPNVTIPTARSYPNYLDIRDDRINFFGSVNSYEKNYYYLVRAVTKGVFKMGPVSADAMYNGEYHSYNGGGIVTIEE